MLAPSSRQKRDADLDYSIPLGSGGFERRVREAGEQQGLSDCASYEPATLRGTVHRLSFPNQTTEADFFVQVYPPKEEMENYVTRS